MFLPLFFFLLHQVKFTFSYRYEGRCNCVLWCPNLFPKPDRSEHIKKSFQATRLLGFGKTLIWKLKMHALALLIRIMCFIPKGMNLRSNVSVAHQGVARVVVMVMICTSASAQLNCSPNITAVGSCTSFHGLVQCYMITQQNMVVVLFL